MAAPVPPVRRPVRCCDGTGDTPSDRTNVSPLAEAPGAPRAEDARRMATVADDSRFGHRDNAGTATLVAVGRA